MPGWTQILLVELAIGHLPRVMNRIRKLLMLNWPN